MAFDTLKFAKRLKEGGFTDQQAEALAQAEAEFIEQSLATKRDVKELEVGLKRDLKELEVALKRDIEELRGGVEAGYRGASGRRQAGYRGAACRSQTGHARAGIPYDHQTGRARTSQ